MTERRDVVVTVPKALWSEWLAEGDLPGQQEWPCYFCGASGAAFRSDTGAYGLCEACDGDGRQRTGQAIWHFYLGGEPPVLRPGARCYVVAHGRLRGYAPVTGIERMWGRRFAIVRRGGGVACTIAEPVRGFQGWRYRWWERTAETGFLDWQTAGVA